MPTGYERVYEWLIPQLTDCDFAEAAPRLGLELDCKGNIPVKFLGRDYLVTASGAQPLDGLPVNVNNRSVLLYYVLSKGAGEPEYSFMQLARFSGILAGQHPVGGDIMNGPLAREFGGDYPRFRRAAEKLGGVCELSKNGRHSWLFHPLPKVPAKIDFYEADDEFPADLQLFFDKTALRFLDFECLAFLAGCVVSALIDAGKEA